MRDPARRSLAVAVALALSLWAPAALSQTVDASSAKRIVKLLHQEGYRAKLERDSQGDPMITSSSQGVNWTMYFYDCDGDRCKSIQFSAGFDLKDGVSLELVNSWNRDKRFATSSLDDENDPFIRYDLNLEGGVTEANFIATLDIWESVLGEFLRHIDW